MKSKIIMVFFCSLILFGCDMYAPEPSIPDQESNTEDPESLFVASGDGKFSIEVDKNGITHIVGIDRYITSELSHKLVIRVWSEKTTFNVHNCKKVIVSRNTKANIFSCDEIILEQNSTAEISSCETLNMESKSRAIIRTCKKVYKAPDAVIEKQIDVGAIMETEPVKKEAPEKTDGKESSGPKKDKPAPIDIDLKDAPVGDHQMK